MGSMTVRYYEQVKDYLHPHLNEFIDYYRYGGVIHVCNRLNKNGIKKEISYDLGCHCTNPSWNRYWRETKDKYRRRSTFYWTRYMTRTNRNRSKTKVTLLIIINLKSTNNV